MKGSRWPSSVGAAVLFFLALALLMVFMDRFRSGVPQSFVVFWVLLLTMFASLVFQIIRFGKEPAGEAVIVFQLVLTSFFFHIVHMVLTDGSFFLNDDAYTMIRSTEYIQQGHRDFFTAGPEYGHWPLSQLLTLSLSYMSGLGLYDVAYYLPSVVSATGTVFLYLLARTVYRDRRVALFCHLAFSFFWLFALRHNGFHPEFLAYIFLVACLFVFFRNMSRKLSSAAHVSLAALFLGVTIPTNITTSSFLTMIIVAALAATWLARVFKSRRSGQSMDLSPLLTFAILALVGVLAYSLYVATVSFETIARTLSDIRPPMYAPGAQVAAYGVPVPTPTLRQWVAGDGFILCSLLFGALMVFEVLTRWKCPERYFDVFFTLWEGVGLVLYLLFGLTPIGIRFFAHFGSRVLNFTYPFLLLGAAHAVAHTPSWRRHAVLAVLLLGFVVVSVSSLQFVPGNLVGTAAEPLATGDNSQEWSALDWFATQFGPNRPDASTTVTNYYVAHFFRYRFGAYPQTRLEFWEKDLAGLKDRRMNWVVVKPTEPVFETLSSRQQVLRRRLDNDTMRRISKTPLLAQSYDNGEWIIYRVVR